MRLRTISLTTRQGCEGRGQPSRDGSPLSRERARTTPRLLIAAHYFWGSSEHGLKFVQTTPLWSMLDHDQYLELPRISNKSGPDLGGSGGRGRLFWGEEPYYPTTTPLL